jgi:excisionase family DNA binding protein
MIRPKDGPGQLRPGPTFALPTAPLAEPLVVSTREAERLLGIGKTRLFAILANGELASFRDGSRRKIPLDALRHYVARRLVESQQ